MSFSRISGVLFLIPVAAGAAPVITTISTATLSHGQALSITGSGFGSKASAAPLVWDNCSGTNILDKWSGAWPNAGTATYQMQYSTPIRGVSLPHQHITKYMRGAHGDSVGATDGYDVIVWKTITPVYPTTVYFSAYFRADPNWVFDPAGLDNNFKSFNLSTTGAPYGSGGYWYLNYTGQGATAATWGGGWMVNDSSGSLMNPDANGHSYYWWTNPVNPFFSWIKQEFELKISNQTDGYFKVWENGDLKVNYRGTTDNFGNGTIRTVALGGYYRRYGNPNNYRYFSDLYFDTSPQRVMLCNGSSWAARGICEVQIPTAWADGVVGITVNQGAFVNGASAYLFVVGSDGSASSGQKITFTGGRVPKPSVPLNVKVQ